MPIVIVNMWTGRDRETKRRIVENITAVFERESIPKEAVSVIIQEIPKDNWGEAGKLSSD